jgi:ABC-type nitrate/sulfonate/bicarbonate transport system permease component
MAGIDVSPGMRRQTQGLRIGARLRGAASSTTAVTALSAIIVLAFWEYFGRKVDPLFASYPTDIVSTFVDLVRDGTLLPAIWATLKPLLLGYGIAALVGIPLGLVLGRYRVVEAALGFYVTGAYAVPMIAIVPILMMWLGLGFTIKVVVVALMAVFPIVINTWAGVRAVPRAIVEVGMSFSASELTILRKVVLPSVVPSIMVGLRLGVGRAVLGVVVAEFFTALSGLGGIIVNASSTFQTSQLFVAVLTLMALALLLNYVMSVLERKVARWQFAASARER